jgi:hypothetical protein
VRAVRRSEVTVVQRMAGHGNSVEAARGNGAAGGRGWADSFHPHLISQLVTVVEHSVGFWRKHTLQFGLSHEFIFFRLLFLCRQP